MKLTAIGSLCVIVCLAVSPLAAQPAGAPSGILPVAGSTGGAFGSHFKTQLQMSNRTPDEASGWLVYRPAAKADALTNLRYELAPHATFAWEDVVAELGRTGLGSIDVVVDQGDLPMIVARAYDDQESGTTGATIDLRSPDEALQRGDRATLIVPANRDAFRFNIGVRALEAGAVIHLLVRSQSGIERHFAERVYEPQWFEQRGADDWSGTVLLPNESITIDVISGSAIVYGTTIDNRTNDSSIQTLERPRQRPVIQ